MFVVACYLPYCTTTVQHILLIQEERKKIVSAQTDFFEERIIVDFPTTIMMTLLGLFIIVSMMMTMLTTTMDALSTTTTTSTSSSSCSTTSSSSIIKEDEVVKVYDNVLPKNSCQLLHEAASKIGLEHKVFKLGREKTRGGSVIERALEEILRQLDDGSDTDKEQYVEYWTRQEWRHIEAHSDVDENLAKEHDTQQQQSTPSDYFRYPDYGHVLYLQVGTDVRGPTCIFPNVKNGGELLSSSKSNDQDKNNIVVDLITVPAVEGRVLRFSGNALHAVPRPTDIWFLSFVKGVPEFSPQEIWGRSVILFNIWSKTPPKDVPTTATGSGEEDSGVRVNQKESWNQVFGTKGGNDDDDEEEEEEKQHVCLNDDRDESTAVDDMSDKVKIWLLGNERRRQYPMRTVKMKGNKDVIQQALFESTKVSHVQITE